MRHEDVYLFLIAEENAQRYLKGSYSFLDDAVIKSYQNSSTFIHYINNGMIFMESSRQSNILVQPVLSFYGMTHFLKGWLLTKRPDYPETTTVLAHGLTARKRKRKDYRFMEDEVKIQQRGLFPYVCRYLFSLHPFPLDRVSMRLLLCSIPELSNLWQLNQEESMVVIGEKNSRQLRFPNRILDGFHLKEETFVERIRLFLPPIKDIQQLDESLQIHLTEPIQDWNGPFRYRLDNELLYFPANRANYFPYSEILVHYLLLFHLSMICRYETEWWGELMQMKTDKEYPLIKHFLRITNEKTPLLIGQHLLKNVDSQNK
ncbi:YaaC family protein [Oceanobacillus jeddahense]|uniref:YaaC family protein n=1 Tax=Oceanobacillus jeddahense TaxID=1462527 RepID=A0ABY5JS61_9BACI|nr:YaaC family protein [Oceanobacillus jeddahense]UUI03167.1 YaaC family protein [Oceanobacillus jeddahense]